MDIQEVLIPKSSDTGSFGPRPLDLYVASLNWYSSSLSFRRLTDVLGTLHHLFYNSIIDASRIYITRRSFYRQSLWIRLIRNEEEVYSRQEPAGVNRCFKDKLIHRS